jgi:TM2 domain-containing membrane protein YozV
MSQTISPSVSSSESITAFRRKVGWAAIILGGLGIHKFMLGYKKAGTIMLLIGVLGWIPFAIPTLLVSLVGIIEGIIYLRKTDAEFDATYLRGKREWF